MVPKKQHNGIIHSMKGQRKRIKDIQGCFENKLRKFPVSSEIENNSKTDEKKKSAMEKFKHHTFRK